jgi:hypothetical protein
MSEEARTQKFRAISEKREEAAKKLNQILPNFLYALEKDE